jgi:hypothetical protein
MGTCKCGYSTDAEKNCNGTHNVVKAVKADLAEKKPEVILFEGTNLYPR